ncbi:hypothetical protein HB364_13610 [Pseudoflavitalea sp. X16]|uniref:hypothetical protein n=1 Tax=Paraflavitalea devenefica TaxID=2716334 RepID=UPI001420C328|nr:hypothetical protein [Paraflavitalea devenefica]NII26125.1 hypothetical protein [Paraflavitalea devenefica]
MKIKNFAVLLVVTIAIAGAFAFKPQPNLNFKYGISSENATGWVVQAVITGESEGVGYVCGDTRTDDCSVESNTAYTVGQTIPYNNGTPEISSKVFTDLP